MKVAGLSSKPQGLDAKHSIRIIKVLRKLMAEAPHKPTSQPQN